MEGRDGSEVVGCAQVPGNKRNDEVSMSILVSRVELFIHYCGETIKLMSNRNHNGGYLGRGRAFYFSPDFLKINPLFISSKITDVRFEPYVCQIGTQK